METKKEFKYFTIFQYEQEQEYLSRRHQEGWKFVKITGLGIYHFERSGTKTIRPWMYQ